MKVSQFQMLLNGKSDFEISEIKDVATYKGVYNKDHATILLLWEIVESFTVTDQRLFLMFITGSDRIPLDGFQPELTITLLDVVDEGEAKMDEGRMPLPRSHTCFNQVGIIYI